MENTTVINPAVQSSSATVTNTEVVEEYNRQNNIETDSSSSITEGTTICDKYKVQSQLEVSSGEADLFLCSDGSRQYVAKVYKRKFAIKQEVGQSRILCKLQNVVQIEQNLCKTGAAQAAAALSIK